MKQIPQIHKFMTTLPHTIGVDIPAHKALEMMQTHRIRHLPVQNGGKLVGVVTDRDVKLASAYAGTAGLKVEDIMTPDPYHIIPETPLDQVVSDMAEHKYGCAIIQQANGKVVGIFTAIDGLRVLSDMINQFYKKGTLDTHFRGVL